MAKKQKQEPDISKVIKRLDKIEDKLDRELKFKRRAQKALLNGIIGSFGATIIFAVIIAVLAFIIGKSDNIPVLNSIIEKTNLETVVDRYNTIDNGEVDGLQDDNYYYDREDSLN